MGFYDDIVGKRAPAPRKKICPHCKREFVALGKETTCREEACLVRRDEKRLAYLREHNRLRDRNPEREGRHGMVKLREKDPKDPGFNNRCPLMCGRCCREILVRKGEEELSLPTVEGDGQGTRCEYLRDVRGCRLPRAERPYHCTGYLCQVAQAVMVGELTRTEGRKITQAMRPWVYRREDRMWLDGLRRKLDKKLAQLRRRRAGG